MRYNPRVLFILKHRQQYGGGYNVLKSSGLLNSANFINELLQNCGIESKLVQVIDNNGIDREVSLYKPNIVIIEALWVIPEKFEILQRLHPHVQWIVRLHSEIPFLSNEGIAFEWIFKYLTYPNVFIAFNSMETLDDIKSFLGHRYCKEYISKVLYLPNYYPVTYQKNKSNRNNKFSIHIGCFGAIRPLKNHLIQAVAAIEYADKSYKKLYFHINSSRIEGHGDPILKNLRALFAATEGKHELIEHDWLSHEDFIDLIKTMDIGLQLSFSETFNIVCADFINNDITIVSSDEVDWMPKFFVASPTHTTNIVNKINDAMNYKFWMRWLNFPKSSLQKYVNESKVIWLRFIKQY